ncbi:hypothetical protein KUV62_16720 [Salipiger bermudensis]|uniref:hypothetical protein n=1 Tax=Salipiger bermudensis TaxID=344736 RepID=UPI001C99D5B0|nr:hypothetical protein [Salipiger bermudensis]MBY6005569.1 hypothetical protein [Salipiger bermudensis]
MKNPIQAMFEAGVVEATDFPPDSRYHGIPTATASLAGGRTVPYLRRRIVPSPDGFATVGFHTVRGNERLDHVAFSVFGDPLAFWRLCDANGGVFPEDLEEPGTAIRLTLPEGVAPPEDEL